MVNRIELIAKIPRHFWVDAPRPKLNIIKDDRKHFRWRTQTLLIKPLKPVLRAAVIAVFMATAARTAHAAFDVPSISAQAAAMGGSSLAGQGDSSALFLNAAGVAGLQNPETYLMYNQLYTGLNGVGSIGQGFAAFGVPTKIGDLAIGYSDFQASGLLEERVIGITFARRLFNYLDIGITGKYLYHNYLVGSDPSAGSNPVFNNGTSRSAPALDAGAIASVTDDLKVGLAVRNVNEPNVGLESEDQVTREIQLGLAYNIKPWALRATADYTYQVAQIGTAQEQNQPGIGLEKSFLEERVKFRFGATLDQLSAGIGLKLGSLGLDYTFLLPIALAASNFGTQMVGLRYQFGETSQSLLRSN